MAYLTESRWHSSTYTANVLSWLLVITEFTHQDGMKDARVWQLWQGYHLRVLSWSSLNINVFWSSTIDLFKGKWSLAKSYFKQNYCHACHRWLAVFFTLPSCCLSSLVMTVRRYIKAASSSQSLTILSTQTIPECFRDRQNPLAYISLVRNGSQCVLDSLLPPSPSPLPHKKMSGRQSRWSLVKELCLFL